jgi:Na+-transporting methylmalonyl-CoA/oxaloacetate decarboxylase gamma subunit
MPAAEALGRGLQVTAIGMSLVFGVLALLWALVALLLAADERRTTRAGALVAAPPPPGAADEPIDDELLAAIVIAVREHRRMCRRQAAPAMRSQRPGSLPSRWVGAGRTRQTRGWARGR